MIRMILALLLAPVLIGAAPDWTQRAAKNTAGHYVIGNPRAKVKLVEYLSYTCPHCGHFSQQSAAVLKARFVRSGSTSIEVRHAVRDRFDLAATIVARCAGAKFGAVSDAIFASQADWYDRAARYERVSSARIAGYGELTQLRYIADAAGLIDIARAHAVSDPAIDACFADTAELKRIAAMTDAAWKAIDSTPSFLVNTAPVAHVDWSGLEPKLRAAGSK